MIPSEAVESIERHKELVRTIASDQSMSAVFTRSLNLLKSLCTKELGEQMLEYELDAIEFQRSKAFVQDQKRDEPMRQLVYALSESISNTARVLVLRYSTTSPIGHCDDSIVKQEDEEAAHGSNMVQIIPMPSPSDAAEGTQMPELPAEVKKEVKEEPLDDALFDNTALFANEGLHMPKLEEEEDDEFAGFNGSEYDDDEQIHQMHTYEDDLDEEEDEEQLFRGLPGYTAARGHIATARPTFSTGTAFAKQGSSIRFTPAPAYAVDPRSGLVASWQNRWQATQQMRYPAAAAVRPQPPPTKKRKIVVASGRSVKAVFQNKDFDYWSGRTESGKCPRCELDVTRGARKKHYLREHYDHYFKIGSSHVNDIERWVGIRLGRGSTYSKPDIRICLHCTDNRDVYRTRLVLMKHLQKRHPEVFNKLVSEYQKMKKQVEDTVLHQRLMNSSLIPIPVPPVQSSSGRIIFPKNNINTN